MGEGHSGRGISRYIGPAVGTCLACSWVARREVGAQSMIDLPGPQYRLEKQSEPNVAVDLESTLESQSAWEFCLVRENSTLASSLHACFVRCNMLKSPVFGNTHWSGLHRLI